MGPAEKGGLDIQAGGGQLWRNVCEREREYGLNPLTSNEANMEPPRPHQKWDSVGCQRRRESAHTIQNMMGAPRGRQAGVRERKAEGCMGNGG